MRKRSESGVTLIEVLIAVSLVSLLSVAILMAIRVGVNAMQKSNARLMDNRKVVSVQQVLEQQLAGFVPVMASCIREPDEPPLPLPFFQGEPESMRFVSTFSLERASRGFMQILEFQVIPGEDNRGVRLVVNEHLYTGPLSAGVFCLGPGQDPVTGAYMGLFRPISVGPRSFVLVDRLAHCRFFFRDRMNPGMPTTWRPVWNERRWPVAVRVDLAPLEPSPARLQILTITAPIRVNRSLDYNYAAD